MNSCFLAFQMRSSVEESYKQDGMLYEIRESGFSQRHDTRNGLLAKVVFEACFER